MAGVKFAVRLAGNGVHVLRHGSGWQGCRKEKRSKQETHYEYPFEGIFRISLEKINPAL
jgi:hypothetical protein